MHTLSGQTLFFIDTAHNVLDYLDQIYRSLVPGGWWINEGPLLWFGNRSSPSTLIKHRLLGGSRVSFAALAEILLTRPSSSDLHSTM